MYHLYLRFALVPGIRSLHYTRLCVLRIHTKYMSGIFGSAIRMHYVYWSLRVFIITWYTWCISWVCMKYLYTYLLYIPAMSIHLLAFALQVLRFSIFCQGYMLYGFLLFWLALSSFWYVASCAVVKSALTQSSYLLVFSVFVGGCLRGICGI